MNQIPWLTDSIRSYIAKASTLGKGNDNLISRTDLDTHANMAVVGINAYILSYTGATAEVNAFTPDHAAMTIQIVDAAVQYNCLYTGITYIMVIHNALYVPSMQHNLIPPFMIREAGIVVNVTPKI